MASETNHKYDRAGTLDDLNRLVDQCPRCLESNNPLQHIYGGGATTAPRDCFILMNPTARNISSASGHLGPRLPFLGIRSFWRVLNESGYFKGGVLRTIEQTPWTSSATVAVLKELDAQGIYLTNLVKCTSPNSENPSRNVCDENLPILLREIDLVKPQRIVTFGQLTFATLTARNIRLNQFLAQIRLRGITTLDYFQCSKLPNIPVFPCFFPVGRGNQKLATELLSAFRRSTRGA